jgi:hypothetical protein
VEADPAVNRLSRVVAAAVVSAALGVPAVALACPACAGRDDGGPATFFILSSMIVLPFGIAAAAYVAVRRLDREEAP